jgi:hypothetical protein
MSLSDPRIKKQKFKFSYFLPTHFLFLHFKNFKLEMISFFNARWLRSRISIQNRLLTVQKFKKVSYKIKLPFRYIFYHSPARKTRNQMEINKIPFFVQIGIIDSAKQIRLQCLPPPSTSHRNSESSLQQS